MSGLECASNYASALARRELVVGAQFRINSGAGGLLLIGSLIQQLFLEWPGDRKVVANCMDISAVRLYSRIVLWIDLRKDDPKACFAKLHDCLADDCEVFLLGEFTGWQLRKLQRSLRRSSLQLIASFIVLPDLVDPLEMYPLQAGLRPRLMRPAWSAGWRPWASYALDLSGIRSLRRRSMLLKWERGS